MAGYSGTPLDRKLGLKDAQRACWLNLPDSLRDLIRSRDFARVSTDLSDPPFDVIHMFTDSRRRLETTPPRPARWPRCTRMA